MLCRAAREDSASRPEQNEHGECRLPASSNGQASRNGGWSGVASALRSPLAPTIALWLCIAAYFVTFTALSILQHDSFGTSIYDLGNVDQAVWNTLHGRILRFTTQPHMGDIRLSMHIEPILLPISLLYLLYSNAKTLLIVQTLAIALGAWPLYLIARLKLRRGWPAVAFALAYLLLPALEAANLFEFHAVVLAPVFLLFTFYFVERVKPSLPVEGGRRGGFRPYLPAFAFAILAMSCKEDIPLLVVTMGLYFLIVGRRWQAGVPLIVLGAIWFYVDIYMVFPAVRAGKGSPFLSYYKEFGDNPFSIGVNLLTHPRLLADTVLTQDNLYYLTGLLFPFGFLPIPGLPTLLIAAPSLAINLLSAFPLMHELEAKQYAVPIVPFVAIAAVYGTCRLGRWLRRERAVIFAATALVLVCSLTYHYFRGFSPLALAYKPPVVTIHHRLAAEFMALIPPDAPLIAQDRLFPHVSQRERAYYVWTPKTDADYIFLDVSHPSFINVNNVHQWLKDQIQAQKEFGLIKAQDGYLLLKRGAPPAPLPDDFYTFVRAQEPQIQHPMVVDFGDAVRFLGYDIVYDRDREPGFVLYWQSLRELEPGYSIKLHLANEAGEIVESTTSPQPALVWYPPEKWKPGETIRVIANTLPWSTAGRSQYGIGLGVARNEVALPPRVKDSPQVSRFLAGGEALEIARFQRLWGIPRAVDEPRTLSRPPVDHPLAANFGGLIQLEGYTLRPGRPVSGQPLRIELLWHPLAPIPESYTAFVHLTDFSGKIWAQQDSLPWQGALPTTAWVPGEYVRDAYEVAVPAEVQGQPLRLEIGWYRAETGERLRVLDPQGQANDDRITLELS